MKESDVSANPVEWLGVRYKTILQTADTGGAMSVIDSVSSPNSGRPLEAE